MFYYWWWCFIGVNTNYSLSQKHQAELTLCSDLLHVWLVQICCPGLQWNHGVYVVSGFTYSIIRSKQTIDRKLCLMLRQDWEPVEVFRSLSGGFISVNISFWGVDDQTLECCFNSDVFNWTTKHLFILWFLSHYQCFNIKVWISDVSKLVLFIYGKWICFIVSCGVV